MKKLLSALTAAFILGVGVQAIAASCENGACELPEKQNQSYSYGNADAYCENGTTQDMRCEGRRGGCGGR